MARYIGDGAGGAAKEICIGKRRAQGKASVKFEPAAVRSTSPFLVDASFLLHATAEHERNGRMTCRGVGGEGGSGDRKDYYCPSNWSSKSDRPENGRSSRRDAPGSLLHPQQPSPPSRKGKGDTRPDPFEKNKGSIFPFGLPFRLTSLRFLSQAQRLFDRSRKNRMIKRPVASAPPLFQLPSLPQQLS